MSDVPDASPEQAPGQRRWIVVAETAAASAGVSKRARHDAITLLRAGERVTVVSSDAARVVEWLRPHLSAAQLERLQVESFDIKAQPLTIPERIALRVARITRRSDLYEDIDHVCHTRALARAAAVALGRLALDPAGDAVIAHGSEFVHATRRAYPGATPPILYVIHSMINERAASGANPYGPVSTAFLHRSEGDALRAAHSVMPVAEAMARAAHALQPRIREVRVIYNSIDEPAALDGDAPPRDLDVLYVGRLSPEKGIDTLLGAVEQLGAGVRLTIVGHGSLAYQVKVKAAAMPERIEYMGARAQPEVLALMRRARVAVVPSYSDPFPFTVLEALSQATPVVASAVSGIPEVVKERENGLLVAPGDSAALARAIMHLLSDQGLWSRLSVGAASTAAAFSLTSREGAVLASYRASVGLVMGVQAGTNVGAGVG